MNAKELRAAAEVAVMQWDNHDRHRLVAGDDVLLNSHGEPNEVTFARHILATVREDDNEPVTEEWRGAATVGQSLNTICFISDIEDHPRVSGCKTRGQFRSLCRGLGIELKEVSRVD